MTSVLPKLAYKFRKVIDVICGMRHLKQIESTYNPMKVVYLKNPGRLLRLAGGNRATSTQAHEYQALITTKLHARARLDEIEARIVDETWRQMLIQAGKHPLPNR